MGRRALRRYSAFAALGIAATTFGLSGCSNQVECSMMAPIATITGRLVSLHGAGATYAVMRVAPGPRTGARRDAPPIHAGSSIVVRYERDEQQFLRVGTSYQVNVWWNDNHYLSSVHMADHNCSGGTVYANGSPIDTSLWSRAWVRYSIYALAGMPFVLLALLALWLKRRHDRAAHLREYASHL